VLIEGFDLEILTPPCEPGAERYFAKARLRADISEVLPFLNAELSGASYTPAANALTWTKDGHKVAFHAYEIDISGIESREWAEEAINELVDLVNRTWERRDELTPSFETIKPLTPMALFGWLPQSNCGECGEATCFNFALKLAAWQVTPADCPPLGEPQYAENLAELDTAIAAAGPA
jgi:ArsR family metal-binding transcriptional regulator